MKVRSLVSVVLTLLALGSAGCNKKAEENKGPTLQSCAYGANELTLQGEGQKVEVQIEQIPKGTLKFADVSYSAVVARSGKSTQTVGMKNVTGSGLTAANTCASNVTPDDKLPQNFSTLGVSDYGVDQNYSYLTTKQFSISQDPAGVIFAVAPVSAESVPTSTSPYKILNGWTWKLYLVGVNTYELRAKRVSADALVDETLVVHYNYVATVLNNYDVCGYKSSPIPLDRQGTALSFKDLPAGGYTYAGSQMYVSRSVGGVTENVYSQEIVDSTGNHLSVRCADGLSSNASFSVVSSAITNLNVAANGPSNLEVKDFKVSPVAYNITQSAVINSAINPQAQPETVMLQLNQGTYRLYQISPSEFELRTRQLGAMGEETDLAVKFSFTPAGK